MHAHACGTSARARLLHALPAAMQARDAELEELQQQLTEAQDASACARAEAGQLRCRLGELLLVEQQLAGLSQQHEALAAKAEALQQDNLVREWEETACVRGRAVSPCAAALQCPFQQEEPAATAGVTAPH